MDVKNSHVNTDGLMEDFFCEDFYLNFVSSEGISGHNLW